jgi:aminoglycoside phosphotransferase (APT) family kinase protein
MLVAGPREHRRPGIAALEAPRAAVGVATARRRIGEELADTLSAIHEVDPAAVGLGEFQMNPRGVEALLFV